MVTAPSQFGRYSHPRIGTICLYAPPAGMRFGPKRSKDVQMPDTWPSVAIWDKSPSTWNMDEGQLVLKWFQTHHGGYPTDSYMCYK